jgi:hypothetical protein
MARPSQAASRISSSTSGITEYSSRLRSSALRLCVVWAMMTSKASGSLRRSRTARSALPW